MMKNISNFQQNLEFKNYELIMYNIYLHNRSFNIYHD